MLVLTIATLGSVSLVARSPATGPLLKTRYASFRLDDKGFVTSIADRKSGKEYSPAGHPSPLLSLHEEGQPNDKLLAPQSAVFRFLSHTIELKYSNGSVATVKAETKGAYCRFQLVSLQPRGKVDNIVWGPVNTRISKIIGDIIGVVRNDDWAIGLMGVDDNTIPGPVVDGDCYGMGYFIHSPDPVKCPVPEKYKEGQWFNIGGNGVCDTAFYSQPEDYFQQVFGTGAKLEPEFGSTIAYHARDRRRSFNHYFALLPGFQQYRRRHMVSDPVPGVDFLGSTVALYACPDDQGLAVLEDIVKNEGMPYITDRDGRWIRNPAAARPTLYWNGPVDKAIEYAKAMGFKDISRDTGEFYSTLPTTWVGHVNYGGKSITYKEFSEMCHKEGLTHGGLHTLCMFLQGGVCNSVTPVPSEHLQTVCRTKLAKAISATETNIVVTDPSFLADKGTWTKGDGSNFLRIGGEMLTYAGISESAPWTITGVTRGRASKAVAHKAGDELVKLMQNCYNGFVPDMQLMLEYAEDYANLMIRNGMDTINFDGYECLMYQNHGYYAMRAFNRRLFETYHKKTGKWPRVTGSNVFGGAWEYMNTCDVGGGNNMYIPSQGRRNIEGKDIGYGFSNSYFPGTFGIQGWVGNLVDAENMMAKAIGWDSTFALSTSQDAIDKTADRDAIFKAFKAWQDAREAQVFTKEQKERLRNPDYKFHLEAVGKGEWDLYTVENNQRGNPVRLKARN